MSPTSTHARALRIAVCLPLVVYVTSVAVRPGGFDMWFDGWLYNGSLLISSATCLWHAARRRGAGAAAVQWALLGAGCLCWTLGSVCWTVVIRPLAEPPSPSAADGLWLCSYVLLGAGIVALGLQHRLLYRLTPLLDAGSAAFAAGAIASGLAFGTILGATSGSRAAVATNLAYLSADLVLHDPDGHGRGSEGMGTRHPTIC